MGGPAAMIGALLGEELVKAGAKATVETPIDAIKDRNKDSKPKRPTQFQMVDASGMPINPGAGPGMGGVLGAPQPPQQQGMGAVLGAAPTPQQPQQAPVPVQAAPTPQQPRQGGGLRHGIGDALMGLGAIGLGQDPFQVMQAQKQARADAQQRELEGQQLEKENQRADQEWGMKQEEFGLKQQEAQQKVQQREAAQKIMLAFAGTPSMFGKEVGETMQNLQALGGATPQPEPLPPMAGGGGTQGYNAGLLSSFAPTSPQISAPVVGGQPQQPLQNAVPPAPQGLAGAIGAQPPPQQGGMGGILGNNPNITESERAGLMQLAQMGDPDVFMSELQKAAMSGPEEAAAPKTALDGMMVWNPQTGQYEVNQSAVDIKRQLAREGRSVNQTTVNMPPGEKAYDIEQGKNLAGEFQTMQNVGAAAAQEAQQFQVLGDMLANTYTGAGAQQVQQLKRVATALGFETEGLPEAQVAQKISRELALKLRNPESGGGMPGALSDADRNFLESMVPGIQNSAAGNRLMTEYMVRLAQRKADVAGLAREYAAGNGGRLDAGWYTRLAEFAQANPLFNDADLQHSQGVAGGGAGGGEDPLGIR